MGADKAHIILLQDYRYSRDVIPWKDLLLLLEGETVKLPAPKHHFTSDVVITTDVLIFATSKRRIVYKRAYKRAYNNENDRKTNMMNSRWRYIELTHIFKEEDQIEMKPCARCFSSLVMMGK